VVLAMELFTRLFGDLLAFVYHCFDRIVIHGYLTGREDLNTGKPRQLCCRLRKSRSRSISTRWAIARAHPGVAARPAGTDREHGQAPLASDFAAERGPE
jgi:hypothetical protein